MYPETDIVARLPEGDLGHHLALELLLLLVVGSFPRIGLCSLLVREAVEESELLVCSVIDDYGFSIEEEFEDLQQAATYDPLCENIVYNRHLMAY